MPDGTLCCLLVSHLRDVTQKLIYPSGDIHVSHVSSLLRGLNDLPKPKAKPKPGACRTVTRRVKRKVKTRVEAGVKAGRRVAARRKAKAKATTIEAAVDVVEPEDTRQ